ncbi:MAG: hypothetical protein ACRDQ5_09195 [Sciscionella sp.]
MTGQTRGPVRHPAEQRAAYRAFVRANHPDVGGDPVAFVAGIAEFEAAQRAHRTRDRFDAPIEVVVQPTGFHHRITRLLRRWWNRRTDPPRVR